MNTQELIVDCRVKAELVLEMLIDLEHEHSEDTEVLLSIVGDAANYFEGATEVINELMQINKQRS